MSEVTEPTVESKVAPEVQQQAEKLGWIPPHRFKGDPTRYVDADVYLERGETILPIVKEHNKRLQTEVETLRSEQKRTADALAAATKAIEEIEERHTVATQKAVEQARRDLKAQLAAASEAGDHEAVAELTDRMVQLKTAEKEAKAAPTASPQQAFVPPPDLASWNAENPWFGTDKRKTALALGIAQELRDKGETAQGRAFFDKVSEEMELTLPSAPAPTSKVEGARNGAPGEARSSGAKGYAALPADAKAACDQDAKQFVGEKKRYKTVADWRNRYAEIYFEGA